MSRSQLHKAKQGISKLERLYEKTLRRLDNLKRNAATQSQVLTFARTKMQELEAKNAVSDSGE